MTAGGWCEAATARLRSGVSAAALAVSAALATMSPVAVDANPGQRFRLVEIIDPNGFGQPMPAMRGLVPAHWQSQGGVVWDPRPQCAADGMQIRWSAWDPQSGMAVQSLPVLTWQANNLPIQMPANTAGPHCLNAPITDVRGYLEALAKLLRPGVRILDFRPQPDLARAAGIQPRRDAMPGGEMRMWAEAGDLLIGYREQGREYREAIRGLAIFTTTTMQGVMPGEIRHFLTGQSIPAFAMRAPEGSFDFRLFDAIQKSFRTDPEWSARMAQHNAEMARINTKGASDRHAIRMETQREISAMMNKSWADRQASQDRSHEKFSRTIRGVELYADPDAGRPVELPNTYQHAWRLRDGTYMMTDDPNFNPNATLGIDGKQLRVTQ